MFVTLNAQKINLKNKLMTDFHGKNGEFNNTVNKQIIDKDNFITWFASNMFMLFPNHIITDGPGVGN